VISSLRAITWPFKVEISVFRGDQCVSWIILSLLLWNPVGRVNIEPERIGETASHQFSST
jgi:hypothetical protein